MKQIKVAIMGAGIRGYNYSLYALDHPEELRFVAVAEPDEKRRQIFKEKH